MYRHVIKHLSEYHCMKYERRFEQTGKTLVIQPEGWIDYIVFEVDCVSSCGQESFGISCHITDNPEWYQPGGAFKREDMQKLIKLFTEHLEKYPLPPPSTL